MAYKKGMQFEAKRDGEIYTIQDLVGDCWHMLPKDGSMVNGWMKTSEELDSVDMRFAKC